MDQDGRDHFEIPKEMRSMAEAGFDQARKAFEHMLSSAQQTAATIEDRGAAARANAKEITTRAVAFAERNVTDLLKLLSYVSVGFMWARMAKLAFAKQGDDPTGFYKGKTKTAKFYMAKLMPQTNALLATILAGGNTIMDLEDELFDAGIAA